MKDGYIEAYVKFEGGNYGKIFEALDKINKLSFEMEKSARDLRWLLNCSEPIKGEIKTAAQDEQPKED